MKSRFPIPLGLACGSLLALAAALITGCRAANPGISSHMASIIVTNRAPDDVETAIQIVFERLDYTEGKSDDDKLVFEKRASFMSGVVYSDWYSGGVWERIKVYRHELAPGQTVVECDGYMVKEHDDPLFAEEKRQYKTKRSHCQKLMDEVAAELKNHPGHINPPATTNAPPPAK